MVMPTVEQAARSLLIRLFVIALFLACNPLGWNQVDISCDLETIAAVIEWAGPR
jgi:hypothetical protein